MVARDFAERKDRQIGQKQTCWPAELRPGRDEATVLVGASPFHREQDRATPFTADADALDQPNNRQQHRAPDADAFIGRHKADRDRRETGHQKGCDQCCLASDSIAPMTENRCPDRSSDKTDEENPECLQDADERVGAGKEELAEDQPRHLSVKQEIVPLDRCADGAGNDSAAQLSAMLVFGHAGSTDLGGDHDISSRSVVQQRRRRTLRSQFFRVAVKAGLSLLSSSATPNCSLTRPASDRVQRSDPP